MNITIIVAVSNNNVIGNKNGLPWCIPEDLYWFRKNTIGKTVIMGRLTYESIGMLLPKRANVVITSNPIEHNDIRSYPSLELALEALKDEPEVMVIGGAQLYAAALPYTNKMIITRVNKTVEGDAFFIENATDGFKLVESLPAEDPESCCTFEIWCR